MATVSVSRKSKGIKSGQMREGQIGVIVGPPGSEYIGLVIGRVNDLTHSKFVSMSDPSTSWSMSDPCFEVELLGKGDTFTVTL